MKYNEQNVIGLIIRTTLSDENPHHTYFVVEGALVRQSTNERIIYNHIITAQQLNSSAWIVVKSKIYELW